MELEGNSNGEMEHSTSGQWHRGPAMRSYLETPGLNLRLVNLPGYSPDFNADEAIWGWARQEATGNQCLGTKVLVSNSFLPGWPA